VRTTDIFISRRSKNRAVGQEADTAELLAEHCRFCAYLLLMGSYRHSVQHVFLPGSTTSRMPFIALVSLLITHQIANAAVPPD